MASSLSSSRACEMARSEFMPSGRARWPRSMACVFTVLKVELWSPCVKAEGFQESDHLHIISLRLASATTNGTTTIDIHISCSRSSETLGHIYNEGMKPRETPRIDGREGGRIDLRVVPMVRSRRE